MMFSHPVTVTGYLLIAAAVFGVFIGMNSRDSFLILSLSFSAEGLGFFLILIGVIAQGFLRIERFLAGIPGMKLAFENGEPMGVKAAGAFIAHGASSARVAELQKQMDELRNRAT